MDFFVCYMKNEMKKKLMMCLTLGFISTCISILVGFRRGNVADLSVISACEVLVVSGGSGKFCKTESEKYLLRKAIFYLRLLHYN